MFNRKFNELLKTRHNPYIIQILFNIIFASIYYFVSFSCLKFATLNSNVSPIWPSTGLAISILILFGRKYIISIFIGALFANLLTAGPLGNAIVIAIGNSLEALAGFYIYHSFEKYKFKLEYLTDLIKITSCSLFAPLISATIGVSSLLIFKLIPIDIASNVWLTWWIADVMGAMLLLPLLMYFKDIEFKSSFFCINLDKKQFLKNIFIILIVLSAFLIVLTQSQSLKYLFLFFPALIFLTFIQNKLIIYGMTVTLAFIAIFLTISDAGPFNISSLNQNLLNLEIFLFTLSLTNLVLVSMSQFEFINKIRLLLFTGWIFWGIIFFILQSKHESVDVIAFNSVTNDIENRIKEKMSDYFQVLMGGRALYMASNEVSSDEWRSYVNSLSLSKSFEGMNGMGVVFKVHDDELDKYLLKVKKDISSDFNFKKVPSSLDQNSVTDKNHYIITFIEPLADNMAARGLDLGSELNRKTAADKARLTGMPALTDRIRLIQDKTKRYGFLAYLPVYKKGFSIVTQKEREIAFSHWIYAPFVTEKFIDTIFKKINNQDIVFQLYNSPEFNSDSLTYDFNSKNINNKIKSKYSSINLGDKTYYIKWSRSKSFTTSNDTLSTWIGFIGSILVLIVILFIINVQNLEVQSKKLATELHRDFMEAQKIVKEQELSIIESNRLATLGEMASSIAHEINNPLTIIAGNNQQIKNNLVQASNITDKEKLLNNTDKIEKTVKRISNIIKGLRLLSRDATNDQMDFVPIQSLLEETLSLCTEKFHHSKIDFTLKCEYQDKIFCRGTQIAQVLINLLNNAHDAVNELETKWIKLEIIQIDNDIKISVTDSGHGIPLNIQDKILQPFFTTKEIGKGTGLGLSISKGIIEAHKGSLSIGTLNGHTCFTVILPQPHLHQKV